MRAMNFRMLIEKAMHEARGEFEAIVKRKLNALMGEAGATPAGRRRARRPPGRPAKAARGAGRRARKGRTRAAPEHMERLREKVLAAMHGGGAMKKGQIMKAARLAEAESERVTQVLHKLRGAGVLSMKGERGKATYALKDE